MKRKILFLAIPVILLLICQISNAQWKIPPGAPLLTKWAKEVSPSNPLPEYPRPQLVREEWLNLNGLWEFAECNVGDEPPFGKVLKERILVPFPIESALSGVMRPAERLWYRRTVTLPKKWGERNVLLHFGAVDWESTVYVNGKLIGRHRGGYDPFSFDITSALTKEGQQEIIVGVFDPSDQGDQPRGKQVLKPGGIWYTPTTGIWQTVWLEPVASSHISDLLIVPDVTAKRVQLTVRSTGDAMTQKVRVLILDKGNQAVETEGKVGEEITIPLRSPKLWSPSNPFLYDLKVELEEEGRKADVVKSYFGMRKIEIAPDSRGINRILLNGEFVMMVGPLDQGFWPDGIYTAPTDKALRYDIEMTKKLGFNMARKHVKVEPDRWYYWADKLGLIVWQDMPSGNNRADESKKQFELELEKLVQTHRNHPSIVMWVVFNEGWGQYDTERLSAWVKQLDPSRLVNNASGWTDKRAGDVLDIHSYPTPKSPQPDSSRAIVLGEFGGLGLAVDGHTWKKEHWGYQGMANAEQLTSRYERFLQRVYALKDNPGLSAAVYTQTTDVEVECNGLMTYDRAIVKPALKRIAAVNRGDFTRIPLQPIVKVFVPTSEQEGRTWKYTTEKPADSWFKPAFDDGGWKSGSGGFGTKETPVTASGTTALKPGKNIIAVHCKQTGGGQYIDVGIVELLPAKR